MIDIGVNQDIGKVVSGRDLYDFLEIQTRYSDWIKYMMKHGFIEHRDFVTTTKTKSTKENISTYVDHELSLDMAKQICIWQRSEKSKQVYEYLVNAERNTIHLNTTMLSAKVNDDIRSIKISISIEDFLRIIKSNGQDQITISIANLLELLNGGTR